MMGLPAKRAASIDNDPTMMGVRAEPAHSFAAQQPAFAPTPSQPTLLPLVMPSTVVDSQRTARPLLIPGLVVGALLLGVILTWVATRTTEPAPPPAAAATSDSTPAAVGGSGPEPAAATTPTPTRSLKPPPDPSLTKSDEAKDEGGSRSRPGRRLGRRLGF